jgi:hypothetical protein
MLLKSYPLEQDNPHSIIENHQNPKKELKKLLYENPKQLSISKYN